MTLLRTLFIVTGLLATSPSQSPTSASTSGTIQTITGVIPVAGHVTAADQLLVPQPPRSAFAVQPPKQTPRLEFTLGSAPDLAPGQPTNPGGVAPAGGGLVVIDNHAVTPAGALIHPTTPEPTAAIHRDTAFYTGNTFAAVSRSLRHGNGPKVLIGAGVG